MPPTYGMEHKVGNAAEQVERHLMVVQYRGVPARCSHVFSESGNADIHMWCRHVKTAEIRSVVSDNDIFFAESDVP